MIDLIPSDDDQALIDTAAAFLAQGMGRDRLRELIAAGRPFDGAFMRRCGELGWFGLSLDEQKGGAGLSVVEEALVFRELGRHLIPGPVLPTALAALVAGSAGETALAARLAGGEMLAGLAEVVQGVEPMILWDIEGVDLLLVADVPGGRAWLIETAGVKLVNPVPSIDPLIQTAWIDPKALPKPMCTAPDGGRIIDHGIVLCAAMLAGIAEQGRDESAAYAKVRVQFGKPIGVFQAVKHRCADMALRAEAAWAQTAVAALRFGTEGTKAAFDVASAKVVATEAAVRNARDNIQNHGGIGFTAEHDAHLYLKRAHVLEYMLGTPRYHLQTTLEAAIEW